MTEAAAGQTRRTEADGVLTLTFTRDEKLNAVSPGMVDALREAVWDLGEREDLKVLVIAAEGRYFTAGIDILDSGAGGKRGQTADGGFSPRKLRRGYRGFHAIFDEIEAIEKPVVLAAHGRCLGVGVELSASCDFRLASSAASFALPELPVLAVIPGSGGVSRVTRLVGPHWGKWLAFGEEVDAAQALNIGLVHAVYPVEEFPERVRAFAARLARLPSEAGVLAGIRVVEISSYAFAATAATVLADWGADVVRVLRPGVPDPFLSNPVGGMDEDGVDVAYMWEIVNRGKRAIELDISLPEGAAVFARLIARADVFITNTLPPVRRKLGIDVDGLRAINPDLIYARASATGPAGPERDLGGFDTSAFWARSGFAHASAALSGEHGQPGIAIGDLSSGVNLAGGISAALFHRLRTGAPSVVDASLLATGAWLASPHIVAASVYDVESLPIAPHSHSRNPLVAVYRTGDDRYLSIASTAGDTGWQLLCGAAERPDLAADERFAVLEQRRRHNVECVAVLDEVFGAHPLATWLERLGPTALAVAEVLAPRAVVGDPQVRANGYVGQAASPSGRQYSVVTTPVQFDETPLSAAPAPRPGQHTDEVLGELGYTGEQLAQLRAAGLIG